MSDRINGILLSAGLGTRLRPYTNLVPKPAIPFLTVPMACYPLSLFDNIGIQNLVVNTHHLPKKIHEVFEKINWPARRLIFSNEEKAILGSGGGIRHAMDYLRGTESFFVANADEVILPNDYNFMKDALAFHRWHKGIATLIVVRHPEVGTKYGGAWVANAGGAGHGGQGANSAGDGISNTRVAKFSKTAVAGHTGYHFVGVMILHERISDYFFTDDSKEENILYETLTNAIAAGENVEVFETKAKWFETGTVVDFLNSTESCIQSAQFKNQDPWVEYMLQVIRLHSAGEYIVEKDKPELLEALKLNLHKWLAG